MYADATNKDANAFNCIQRGHQNSLEGFPLFLGLLLVDGVKVEPRTCAMLSATYGLIKRT